MPVKLYYRKAHTRQTHTGPVNVAGSWILREVGHSDHHVNNFQHKCPMCGADIRSVKMPNGGWAHFEARGGLKSLKHPCFYPGEHILHRRDPNTRDLFEHL